MSIMQMLLSSVSTVATDAYFKYVTLLLHGNGTNGAQNNTFLDGGPNTVTITRNGNTTQGTFSPYGDNWSVFFDGTGDYLSVAANAAFLIGTNNFTIECWINISSVAVTRGIVTSHQTGGMFQFYVNTNRTLYAAVNNNAGTTTTYATASSTSTITVGTWNHVALVRNGTEVAFYINGVKDATTITLAANQNIGSYGGNKPIYIGAGADTAGPFLGYISNVRYVVGSAVYTSNFTPSTTPLTAISNTKLLTCQNNRFIDNSTNAFTITRNGDSSVQRYGPFSPVNAYSTTTIGGSGYFDGSGDYLVSPALGALGTNNFTFEGWIYPTAVAGGQPFGNRQSVSTGAYAPIVLLFSSGSLLLYSSSNGSSWDKVNGSSIGTFTANQWYHVAIVRNGNSLYAYVNGVQTYTVNISGTSYAATYSAAYIGGNASGDYYTGYITDIRINNGTAVYTAAFTPSTSPATAIANTSLLLNFTNAGIIDNAMMNDLETVGNAQVSTTQSKFGESSIYLDGTGDWLITPNRTDLNFNFGDFTVEAWVYTTSTAQQQVIGAIQNSNGAGSWMFTLNYNSNKLRFYCRYNGGTALDYQANAGSFPTNTWTHIAVTRNGANLRMFIDGTQVGTTSTTLGSFTIDNATANYRIGSTTDGALPFVGYIDDLRVTKGYARYTANFTVPSSPFEDQ